MPAATPPSSREMARISMLVAKNDINAAGIPSESPRISMPLRPKRSPRAPRYSTEIDRPSENPTATRLRPTCEASSSLPIWGRPTLATDRFMFATPAPRMRAVRAAADLALLRPDAPDPLDTVGDEEVAIVSILPEFLTRAPIALLWTYVDQAIGGEFACPALP